MSFSYVIDTSAWLEYFGATAKGIKIKALIEQEEIATSLVALLEIADKFERESRRFEICRMFIQRRAAVLPLTVELALAAAKLKKKQMENKGNPNREHSIGSNRSSDLGFSIADGVHLATAQQEGAVLVTSDNDFRGLENVMLL